MQRRCLPRSYETRFGGPFWLRFTDATSVLVTKLRDAFWRPVLAEIYRCNVGACHEIINTGNSAQNTRDFDFLGFRYGLLSSIGARAARPSRARPVVTEIHLWQPRSCPERSGASNSIEP
jgi:hypothetical protein